MSHRNGSFLDRILEAIVAICAVLFLMGGPGSFALIGGVAAVCGFIAFGKPYLAWAGAEA